ncbi:hypothetical protein LMH73_021870 [Vibrio splendidus]|nr:hypothetical protein [Vibrio splendidus]MCC4880495.1 hypothetical protein [Vibrio splendidus]
MQEIIQEYRDKLNEQAIHIRKTENITTTDHAAKYLAEWSKTQMFSGGIMNGKRITPTKMCAVLSHVINPNDNPTFSMDASIYAWEIFFKARNIEFVQI